MKFLTQPVALVSGASTGIGETVAIDLAKHGWKIYAGVRKLEDGERLKAFAPSNIYPVSLDITNTAHIQTVYQILKRELNAEGLQGLVNNAGIAVNGPMEFLNLGDIREQFEINFFAQLDMIQTFLPLIRSGQGRIVNMSSISGRVAMPFFGPYSSSKFAFAAISDSLRFELRRWKIHVSVIEPGSINTPIWEKSLAIAQERLEKLPEIAFQYYRDDIDRILEKTARTGKKGISPQHVANAVRHALTANRPKNRYVVGGGAKIAATFARYAPSWLFDWVVSRVTGFY
jgi:NAD(P)-dependent dehydrogenase (short-subunit alcohol dehydrogenase family)